MHIKIYVHIPNTMKKNNLYILTDDFYTPDTTIFAQVKEILDCDIKLIQYRSKKQIQDEKLVASLISLCEDYNANLVINDNVNLAKKLGAHGVHVGKDDKDLNEARAFLGKDKIVGVSCYGNINLALNAQENGASYVAFGALYQSSTKKDAKIFDINLIDFSKIQIPTCLIGGINMLNIKEVLKYKAEYIAIVSAAYKPLSIKENLQNLQNIIKE